MPTFTRTARTTRLASPFALGLALSTALGLAAAPALAAPILVTSTADSGEGSLRAALALVAEGGGAGPVIVATDGDIVIEDTLSYAGRGALTIIGSGQTIRSAGDVTLLAVTEGADLSVSGLSFAGPGGFDINNRGDLDGTAGKGIFVDLRDDQTGEVTVRLTDVTVSGTANHGIHVSDCTLADECGGGGGGAGEGSPASILLDLTDVAVADTALGRFDADGVRVDERGEGGIQFSATRSTFRRVGADGVELDEGQDGGIVVTVSRSSFQDNGFYCDPALLGEFMPEVDEAEFEQGTTAEDAIPGPVTGSPDDRCFEREVDLYDDGSVEAYEFGIDVDDGFDIDEAGPGSMVVRVTDSVMTGNFDEGFDFDEEGPGSIDATFIGTVAFGNTDDAYKMSEEDAGDVIGILYTVSATDNGGVGIVFEEEDDGDVLVHGTGLFTSGNDDGEVGLEVVQEDAGDGVLRVHESQIDEEIETEGVTVLND